MTDRESNVAMVVDEILRLFSFDESLVVAADFNTGCRERNESLAWRQKYVSRDCD